MSEKQKGQKEYDNANIELSETFESYRKSKIELGRLRAKHKVLLSAIANKGTPGSDAVNRALDKELDRQQEEFNAAYIATRKAYKNFESKRIQALPQVISPFQQRSYQESHKFGSSQIISSDQIPCGPDDISECRSGTEFPITKIGKFYISHSELEDEPHRLRFISLPWPLVVNQPPSNDEIGPWVEMYYATDSLIGTEKLTMNVQGTLGMASYGFAYAKDITMSPCGIELWAKSYVEGLVDVGGYHHEVSRPDVQLYQQIIINHYRGLGASIFEVNLFKVTPYQTWLAFIPPPFEIGAEPTSDNPSYNPERVTITTPGINSIKPWEAEVYTTLKDVKAGDSFIFWYYGSAAAVESGANLWFHVYRPRIIDHSYPAPPEEPDKMIFYPP